MEYQKKNSYPEILSGLDNFYANVILQLACIQNF